MEDVLVRPRYHRQNVHSRRRKRNVRENGAMLRKIARQLILSALILIIVGIIKSINTPVTNYLSRGIKDALTQNIEIGNIYSGVDSFISKLLNIYVSPKSETPITGVSGAANPVVLPVEDSAGGGSLDYSSYFSEGDTQQIQNTVKSSGSGSSPGVTEIAARGSTDVKSNTAQSLVNQSISKKNNLFVVPVPGILASTFGNRISPTKETKEYHKGVDIAEDMGTSIKAVLDGEVIEAGLMGTFGYCIKIEHANGLETLYAHCSRLIAKKGEKVKQGDVIAKVGSTGASTGPHLHFEVLKNGSPVNPLNYIKVPTK